MLTDIAAQVEEVLTGAAPALVASGAAFLTLAWLEDVAKSSPRIADLVAEAARAAGYAFTGSEGTPVPVEAGCFPLDRMLLPHLLASNRHAPRPASAGFSSIPDHILLWRMLALGKSDLSRELTKLVPELSEPRRVADARPSDLELLTGNRGGSGRPGPRMPSASPGGWAAIRWARRNVDGSSGSRTSWSPSPPARTCGTSRT